MSDPVTNVQIEDVLSSIRRLVSTDDHSDAEPELAQDDTIDALVLTPALRVSDTDKTPDKPEDQANADTAEDLHQDGENASDEVSETVADDITFSHHSEQDEDTSDDQHEAAAEAAEADDGIPLQDACSDEDAHDQEYIGDQHEEQSQDNTPDQTTDAQGEASDDASDDDQIRDAVDALTARVAGFEEAVAARNYGWEPDGDSDDDNAAQPMASLPWQDYAADEDGEGAEIVSSTEGLGSFEPEEDDLAPELETPAFAAAIAMAENAFDNGEDPLSDEAMIIDEDALRDLVTDIVREELQGVLGERITRNVRKLVRREIHRALAAKELE